jgi:hypothetical protein
MGTLRSSKRLRPATPKEEAPVEEEAQMGTLRSGKRLRPAAPEEEAPVEEEAPAGEWHPVWVAIHEGGGIFKHWSVFVEDEEDRTRSFKVHVQGASGTFRYEQRRFNAHVSRNMLELIQVGHVHQDNLSLLRQTARRVRIRNDDSSWNCQDFVWTVLKALAEAGVIDGDDEIYTTGTETLWSRMEGLA